MRNILWRKIPLSLYSLIVCQNVRRKGIEIQTAIIILLIIKLAIFSPMVDYKIGNKRLYYFKRYRLDIYTYVQIAISFSDI